MKLQHACSDVVVWEASAAAHAQSFVDELFRLPERFREELRTDHDIVHVKRASEGAGLVFTSEQPR